MTKQDIINEMSKEEMAERIIALQDHIKDLEQEQIDEMKEHQEITQLASTTISKLSAENKTLKTIIDDLNSKLSSKK